MESKILVIIIILFIQTNSQIKQNPILLINSTEPIDPLVLSSKDQYYYIITSGQDLKIEKESGNIISSANNNFKTSNFLNYLENIDNNYIYNITNYFYINCNPFISYQNYHVNFGSTVEDIDKMTIVEIISHNYHNFIFGYYNDKLIICYDFRYCTSNSYNYNIKDLFCKLIDAMYFMCAMIIKNQFQLKCFQYKEHPKHASKDSIESCQDQFENNLNYKYTKIIGIYDVYNKENTNRKFICGIDSENFNCLFFEIKKERGKFKFSNWSKKIELNEWNNNLSEEKCCFSSFNHAYLFCCPFQNSIKCMRIRLNNNLETNRFEISMPGDNSYLTIKSNDNFLTLFFMNQQNSNYSLYEYYIYLPECNNIPYTLFHSLNENKEEENKERLSNLFSVKTNKYYFKILHSDYDSFGYFKLNDTKINDENLIIDNYYILDFNVSKTLTTTQTIYFNYLVYVEEQKAYEDQCTITITIKVCYHSCETCIDDYSGENSRKHNCLICKESYYPSPDNNNNCYTIDEKPANWYFDSNHSKFEYCESGCTSCTGQSSCTSCRSGLYLDNGLCKQKCSSGYFPSMISVNSYSFNDYYYKCNKCYENCQTCSNEGNSDNMKCDSCKDNQIKYQDNCYDIFNATIKSFYLPETSNSQISSCFEKFYKYIKEDSNECIILPSEREGYYLSNQETGLLSKCHDNCLTCENGPIINSSSGYLESMECKKCKYSNMIKIESNCFEAIQYDEMKIIFNISEINPDNHFGTCFNFGKAIFHGDYECIEKPHNTYYVLKNDNDNTGIVKYCHHFCDTCFDKFNNQNTNCIECAQGYVKESGSDTNCIINSNSTSEPFNDDECTTEFFDEEKTINQLKAKIKNDISSYIGSCKVFNGSNFLASVISSSKISPEKQIQKGISAYDLGNCTNVLKEYYEIPNDENLIVINMETKINKSNEKENNIDDNKSFNVGKTTQIEIYDYSGRKLNLSICQENIKIMKYIGDIKEIDIDSAETLSGQGIDVFNSKDKFFNDLCHPYDNPDGKDIILKDRIKDIYKNVAFCQDGCTYNGMNYTLKAANCLCNSNSLEEEKNNNTNTEQNSNGINFEKITKSFIENLFNFNFDAVKCYNLILNVKNLLHNIGFLCLASMFVLQIIFFVIYLIKKLKSLKYFLLIFKNRHHDTKNTNKNILNNKKNNNTINHHKKIKKTKKKIKTNPPRKNNHFSNKKEKYIKNKSEKNPDNKMGFKNYLFSKIKEPKNENPTKDKNLSKHFDSKINIKNNIFISNNFASTINNNNPLNNIPFEFKNGNNLFKDSDIINFNQNSKLNEIKLLNEDNNQSNKESKKSGKKYLNCHKMETVSGKNNNNLIKIKNNKGDVIKLSKTDSDIQDLDYEEAIIYDKRSYLRMYWGFLVDSQLILETFYTDNNLELFVIKLSFLVFTFQISFFLNAFFYSDEYISDAYHNDGVLDFFSGLPKSIYSFIATLIITNLLRMLSSSRNELMRIIRKYKKNDNYENIVNIKLMKLRKKLIVYFILVFLFESFFLYYVTVFCAVYKNSQKYWFFGCLESFGMDSLVAFITCIFLAFFRYISIKYKIKCFYVLARIISTFL